MHLHLPGGQCSLMYLDKNFNLSIDLYTEAIALNSKDSTLWNNRGMSKSRMEEHGAAIADASTSLSIPGL